MKNKKLYFLIAAIIIIVLAVAGYIIAASIQRSENSENNALEVQDGTGSEGKTNDVFLPKD